VLTHQLCDGHWRPAVRRSLTTARPTTCGARPYLIQVPFRRQQEDPVRAQTHPPGCKPPASGASWSGAQTRPSGQSWPSRHRGPSCYANFW